MSETLAQVISATSPAQIWHLPPGLLREALDQDPAFYAHQDLAMWIRARLMLTSELHADLEAGLDPSLEPCLAPCLDPSIDLSQIEDPTQAPIRAPGDFARRQDQPRGVPLLLAGSGQDTAGSSGAVGFVDLRPGSADSLLRHRADIGPRLAATLDSVQQWIHKTSGLDSKLEVHLDLPGHTDGASVGLAALVACALAVQERARAGAASALQRPFRWATTGTWQGGPSPQLVPAEGIETKLETAQAIGYSTVLLVDPKDEELHQRWRNDYPDLKLIYCPADPCAALDVVWRELSLGASCTWAHAGLQGRMARWRLHASYRLPRSLLWTSAIAMVIAVLALVVAQRIRLESEAGELRNQARTLHEAARYDEALARLEDAERLWPDESSQARLALARCYSQPHIWERPLMFPDLGPYGQPDATAKGYWDANDGHLRHRDLTDGRLLGDISIRPGRVLAFHRRASLALVVYLRGDPRLPVPRGQTTRFAAEIWDLASQQRAASLSALPVGPLGMDLDTGSGWALFYGSDQACLWNFRTGQERVFDHSSLPEACEVRWHGAVNRFEVLLPGRKLLGIDIDGHVQELASIAANKNVEVETMRLLSPTAIAVLTTEGQLHLLSTIATRLDKTTQLATGIQRLATSPSGTRLLALGGGRSWRLYGPGPSGHWTRQAQGNLPANIPQALWDEAWLDDEARHLIVRLEELRPADHEESSPAPVLLGTVLRMDLQASHWTPVPGQLWARSLCWDSQGRLWEGTDTGHLFAWDPHTDRQVCSVQAHEAAIVQICSLPDSGLLTCAGDGTWKLWKGLPLAVEKAGDFGMSPDIIDIAADGKTLLVAERSKVPMRNPGYGRASLFKNFPNDTRAIKLECAPTTLLAARISPDGQRAWLMGSSPTMAAYSVDTGDLVESLRGPGRRDGSPQDRDEVPISSFTWKGSGELAWTGDQQGRISLFDLATHKSSVRWQASPQPVTGLFGWSGGARLCTASWPRTFTAQRPDRRIRIWNLQPRGELPAIDCRRGGLLAHATSPWTDALAISNWGRRLSVWTSPPGPVESWYRIPPPLIYRLLSLPVASHLALCSHQLSPSSRPREGIQRASSWELLLFDLETREVVARLPQSGPQVDLLSVRTSMDGSRMSWTTGPSTKTRSVTIKRTPPTIEAESTTPTPTQTPRWRETLTDKSSDLQYVVSPDQRLIIQSTRTQQKLFAMPLAEYAPGSPQLVSADSRSVWIRMTNLDTQHDSLLLIRWR